MPCSEPGWELRNAHLLVLRSPPIQLAWKDSTAQWAEVKPRSTVWLCTGVNLQLHLTQLLPSLWNASSSLWEELSVQHQLACLPVSQQSRRCWARHGQQHNTAQKCSSSYGPGSRVETSALSSLFFCSSLHCCFSFPSPTSLLLPVCSPPLHHLSAHHLLSSSVQVFRVTCPNPETGCSYSSTASSPERKKFQYFNIRFHPNSGRKTEIRDSL